ncbi:MAG: diacylglycerol kinase family protein [Acholeplasmataceae bacterium]|nr:diacylglycerol kinase family lipid kinase [Acholeplasmataceae bacterium]
MKYLLMYNPVSGKAKFHQKLELIKTFFNEHHLELDIYESKRPRDLEQVAFERAKMYDVFLVAGGDGTINEVVNGMMKSNIRPKLGVLPTGTANDIAAIFGMSKNIRKALKRIIELEPVKIDVNQVNDTYFIYTTSCGMLSKISYDVSRRRIRKYGYLAYVFAGMRDLIVDYNFPLKIYYNNTLLETDAMMVLGLSTNRVGGIRLFNFSKNKLNDGLFELRIFTRVRLFRRLRILSSFIRGGIKLKEDYHLASGHFKIETNPDVMWNADGESATKGNVVIQTHQEALNVFMTSKNRKKYL